MKNIAIQGNETSFEHIFNSLQIANIRLETKQRIACHSQIIIFDENSGNLLEMFPKSFDESKRPLFILAQQQGIKLVPTGIITDIVQYFEKSKFAFFCLFCKTRFSGKGSKHRCRKRRSCFACHKYLLQKSTYLNLVTQKLFCLDEMEPKVYQICKACNVTIRNEACFLAHSKYICRWGWLCPHCKKYTFRSQFLPTIEKIKESHTCRTFFCKFCGAKVLENLRKQHLCPLHRIKVLKYSTKLAFIQMSFMGRSPIWCVECLNAQACTFCQDQRANENPNIAVLFLETSTGIFDAYTFYDHDLNNYCNKEKKVFRKTYFSKICYPQKRKGKLTYFNQTQKIKIVDVFSQQADIVDQVLQFIIKKDFSNTTLLTNGSQTNELSFFMNSLIRYGFKPKVLRNENRVLLVECPELCLRILDTQNYFSLSHYEIARKENIPYQFFPKKWNKKSCYSYEGQCPPIDDFYCFEDSEIEKKEKRAFVMKFTETTWSFQTQIKLHTTTKTLLTAVSTLNFLQASFQLQESLQATYNNTQIFLHPINRPLLTYSAFIYQLFLLFCNANIKMVKGPIEYKSSKGEIEFAKYLEQKLVHTKLQHAWSIFGQTKEFLPTCIPDIYNASERIVYFFNGCVIHNHDKSKCLFHRKSDKNLFPGSQPFSKKMNDLAKVGNLTRIKVMWQCQWHLLKKKNPEVKQFMLKRFKTPPTYRLDVRCAGN